MPGIKREMDGSLFCFWIYNITNIGEVPPECGRPHAMAKWKLSAIIGIIWSGQSTAKTTLVPSGLSYGGTEERTALFRLPSPICHSQSRTE